MSIKDLRKVPETQHSISVDEALEVLKDAGFSIDVVETTEEDNISEAKEVLKADGYIVFKESNIDDEVKEKIVEFVSGTLGHIVLDAEMVEKIDDELEKLVDEKVQEKVQKIKESNNADDDTDADDNKNADDDDDGEKDKNEDKNAPKPQSEKKNLVETLFVVDINETDQKKSVRSSKLIESLI